MSARSAAGHPGSDPLVGFLGQVGQRVRSGRRKLGYSRRVLAEKADVSQRTIVLLESGTGNISLALLFRIAQALSLSVGELVGPSGQANPQHLLQRFPLASVDRQQQILNLLSPEADLQHRKQQRVCLLGLRGAGKSTLGQRCGQRLELPFVELNTEIEKLAGFQVAELISLYGQDGYRQLECEALTDMSKRYRRVILAAAGGIVEHPASHAELLKNFHTVWLKTSPEEHMQRVRAQGDERPMAGNSRAMAALRSILLARQSRYAMADYTLETQTRSERQSLDALVSLVAPLLVCQ